MDDAWVQQWRDGVRADVDRLLSTFESRFGFPAGEHVVAGPATAAELAGLAGLHGAALPAGLMALHRVVAEVRLPDVGNGYWIHRPPPPGEDPGHPRLLDDGRAVVVFGSDGGGALFALPGGSDAPVLRLADGASLGGRYDADRAGTVAASLREFLVSLRIEIATAAGA